MLEKRAFQPPSPPSDPRAERFIPKFVYCDPQDPFPVEIKEEFYGSRRKLRIGVLGAGISALGFLHHLFELIPEESVEIVVYEKHEDVGGVWLSTTYPGCRVDSASVNYQFPWRTNIWSQFHSPQPEIRDYLQEIARENDWYKYMKFRHEIVAASWTDEEAKWTLKIKDLVTAHDIEEKFDLFVELNGCVSNPRITVPGIEAFKGTLVHPANWPKDLDLKNKRVALLGYGSSGVQLAPNILPHVSKLYTFIRNKAYMLPSPGREFMYDMSGTNFYFSEEQKKLLRDPDVYLSWMKMFDDRSNRTWDANINGTKTGEMVKGLIKGYMQEKLKSKPELYELMVPVDYDFPCRRPTLCAGYLEALVDNKTTVYDAEPQRYTETGFVDPSGQEHEVDIIIAATGFDQSHMPRYPKFVNGEDMSKRWAARGKGHTYMAILSENMSNYFSPGTAYSPLYRNWFNVIEILSPYMAKVINKMQIDHIVSFTPKTRAVDHFVKHADTFMQRTVQAGPCSAWYKAATGRPSLWPGSHSHYMQVLADPRFEDFDLVYEDEEDMFSYFGNGVALHPEAFPEEDSTWYLGQPGKQVPPEVLEKLKGCHATPQFAPNLQAADSGSSGPGTSVHSRL